MNIQEAALVLAKVQAYDNRRVADANIAAWAEALGEIPVAHALAAVAQYFSKESSWCMPSHIAGICREPTFRRARAVEAQPEPNYPADLTDAERKVYRERYKYTIVRGWPEEGHYAGDMMLLKDLGKLDEAMPYRLAMTYTAQDVRAALNGVLVERRAIEA